MWSNFECHKWVIKKSKKPGNVGDFIIFTTSQNCDKIQLVFSCDKKSLAIWNDSFSHSSIRLWLKVLCLHLHFFFVAWPPLWCENFLVWYGLVKPVSSMYTIQQINSVSNWTSKQQKAWLPVPCIIWPAWCKLSLFVWIGTHFSSGFPRRHTSLVNVGTTREGCDLRKFKPNTNLSY